MTFLGYNTAKKMTGKKFVYFFKAFEKNLPNSFQKCYENCTLKYCA